MNIKDENDWIRKKTWVDEAEEIKATESQKYGLKRREESNRKTMALLRYFEVNKAAQSRQGEEMTFWKISSMTVRHSGWSIKNGSII